MPLASPPSRCYVRIAPVATMVPSDGSRDEVLLGNFVKFFEGGGDFGKLILKFLYENLFSESWVNYFRIWNLILANIALKLLELFCFAISRNFREICFKIRRSLF